MAAKEVGGTWACLLLLNTIPPAPQTQAVRGARMLLLQREVPERVNIAFAEAAAAATGASGSAGSAARVMLDAGGDARPVSARLLRAVDVLAPNEQELANLSQVGLSLGPTWA